MSIVTSVRVDHDSSSNASFRDGPGDDALEIFDETFEVGEEGIIKIEFVILGKVL